jgi:hypothetical protein
MDIAKIPDWRLFVAAEVGDVKPNSLGAQAGDLVVVMTATRVRDFGQMVFPKVSPYRLALSIATRASREAITLRKDLQFSSPTGAKSRALEMSSVPALYDYFEQCMIAATFSYQRRCTGEWYKSVVKPTFAKHVSLKDRSKLFNLSLDGNVRRAIDIHEGDEVDDIAFKKLVRDAVVPDEESKAKASRKKAKHRGTRAAAGGHVRSETVRTQCSLTGHASLQLIEEVEYHNDMHCFAGGALNHEKALTVGRRGILL